MRRNVHSSTTYGAYPADAAEWICVAHHIPWHVTTRSQTEACRLVLIPHLVTLVDVHKYFRGA